MIVQIAEVALNDGEVISLNDKGFYTKLLNRVPKEELHKYFLNKHLYDKIKQKHKESNGLIGLNIIQLKNVFSFDEIEVALQHLKEIKAIEIRDGINNEMYFINKKK